VLARRRGGDGQGNLALALERGERIERQPALYIQGDTAWSIRAPISIASSPVTAMADGRAELELIEGEGEAFIARKSASLSAARAIARTIEFAQASMA
jgi:hypothetical protein